jgi:hypothetical protein
MLAKLVAIEHGVFDDGHEPGQTFGGFGFIRSPRSRPDSGISGYYLRLRREIAPFDQGVAREVRHTVGARTWGRRAPTDYNYEVIFQWGSFGDAPIRAWALATDTGYELRSSSWPMRVAVRAALTTGDRRPDSPPLQTFNPLFPGTAYSGRAGLVGPANSIDVTPSVRLTPGRRLTLTVDHAWYWRRAFTTGCMGLASTLLVAQGGVAHATWDANSPCKRMCDQMIISRSASPSRPSSLAAFCARRGRVGTCCTRRSTRHIAFSAGEADGESTCRPTAQV